MAPTVWPTAVRRLPRRPLNDGPKSAFGYTANSGIDTSAAQTFTITVAADSTPPTVVNSAPTANANVAENTVDGTVTVTGTASDNKLIQKVEVKLYGGDFVAANTVVASGGLTANYSLPVSPVPGLNTVSVRSTDASPILLLS